MSESHPDSSAARVGAMSATFEIRPRPGKFALSVRRVGRVVLDLLYPPLCLVCRAPVGEPRALCAICWGKITFFDGPMCGCCGLAFEIDPGTDSLCASCLASPPAFDRARAAMAYEDTSKGAILALKRADRLEFAQLFAL